MNTIEEGWELFQKINYRGAEMAVRVYNAGQMSLTKAVRNALGTDYVELLYNKESNKIGIRPSNEDSQYHYKLRKPKKQNTWLLGAAAFIRYYQLEEIKGNKYAVRYENEMAIVDITNPLKT